MSLGLDFGVVGILPRNCSERSWVWNKIVPMWAKFIVPGLMISSSAVMGSEHVAQTSPYWPKVPSDCTNVTLLDQMDFSNWKSEHHGHLLGYISKYQTCLLAARKGCKEKTPDPVDLAIIMVIFLVFASCLLYFAFFRRNFHPSLGIMSFFTDRNKCNRQMRSAHHSEPAQAGPIIYTGMPASHWNKLDVPPGYKELKGTKFIPAPQSQTIPSEHLPSYDEAVKIPIPPRY
eukprot:maker-scaffold1125_size61249-snap-gene-0.16 protein:Tk00354 transcript:maker-scaffold1125_size61249-snap-gene-0.16-mRNA-1 annotation:"lipocalin"